VNKQEESLNGANLASTGPPPCSHTPYTVGSDHPLNQHNRSFSVVASMKVFTVKNVNNVIFNIFDPLRLVANSRLHMLGEWAAVFDCISIIFLMYFLQ
jgi:hypothetical protein